MYIAPTAFDLWCARKLIGLLKCRTVINVGVQRAISSNLLGGLWFGLALFVFWVQAEKKQQDKVRDRIVTILFGSTLAIIFTLIAGALISWPPPVHTPGLEPLYLGRLEPNPNTSSFPSQSVALYGAVAAGIYSLNRKVGVTLWILVAAFVAFPRMFVGGHFLTDVVVGFALAVVGYSIARFALEAKLTSKLNRFLSQSSRAELFKEVVVFLWIIQVSVEFQAATWLRNFVESLMR